MYWDKNKVFRTQDKHLVAFLVLNGINFTEVEDEFSEGHMRVTFVFAKTNPLLKLYGQFNRGETLVEPRSFGRALKDILQTVSTRKWGEGHNTTLHSTSSVMEERDGKNNKT